MATQTRRLGAAEILGLAQRLHAAGNAAEAARAYGHVLAAQPKNRAATAGLARLHIAEGELDDAERLVRAALEDDPAASALQGLAGLIELARGAPAAALACFETALTLAPGAAPLQHNRGQALAALGRPAEAAAAYRAAIALAQTCASWSALGQLLLAQSEPGAAEALAAAAALAPPAAHEAAAAATVHLAAGRHEEAAAAFRKAIAAGLCDAGLLNDLGAALAATAKPEAAALCFRRALHLAPSLALAHSNLGNALAAQQKLPAAIDSYRAALQIDPDLAEAHANLGCALVAQFQPEAALTHLERALALDPKLAEAQNVSGQAQVMLGDLQAARRAFAEAVALRPDTPHFHIGVALTDPQAGAAPDIARLQALAGAREEAVGQASAHFALFRMLDRRGEYEAAFTHLAAAKALRRAHLPFEPARAAAFFAEIATVFDAARLAAAPPIPATPDLPIFILGMPRSGSTLAEQIISSHPLVAAAGEVHLLSQAATEVGKGPYPATIARLGAAEIDGVGAQYRRTLSALHPEALRITDKMLGNFYHIGLIRLALPGARIIHTKRDPLETCFSCFSQAFGPGLPYVNDLAELGQYYRAYAGLMAHWRAALPAPFIYELDYETLVENFETEVRRLLAFCGLEFHRACLAFHENKRAVFTASGTQVRQPLYRDSLKRTAAYAKWLEPLREALNESSAS
jgi:tetratricopeptide (TPR) repeat protein